MTTSQWIINVNSQTFQQEVIEQSMRLPVVIDFWAEWCEPCKTLMPLLDKLAIEHDGKFLLAKVNIEESQEVAGAFGISSIPFVAAVFQGEIVNQFQGLLPEAQIREWLETFLPSRAQELMTQGMALEETDPQAAEAAYVEALGLEPDVDAIKVRLAIVILAQNRDDEAREIITKLEERGYLEPEAEVVKSQLELRATAAEAGGVEEARAAVAANPENLSLQLILADALAVANKHREALEKCIELIQKDKSGIGQDAKETMVKIFDMLGPQSQLVSEFRRKLATLLY
ncbi:FIG000875: Thioredoxin domain-containing protein EC-YbbN [hydrothermal vent metagenome]|uniref:FIG000875: Thioredoxin domain-containing protein EC-YbbN n=1 Tax=hydrothermal vent metagenome TaxID=652676 RepID=A0A3B1DIL0_9ZZZZ